MDGVETEKLSLLNGAYIGARLTEGTHTVELKYEPEWCVPGVIVSVVCALVFVLFAILFPKGIPTWKRKVRVPRLKQASVEGLKESSERKETENHE